jgi:DeoR family suf operon transcriptional repressor
MTTRRDRILDYLRTHASVTLEELAQALKIEAAAVRYHLRRLEEAGLIESRPWMEGKRGRPRRCYSLSRRLHGDNLPMLVTVLLMRMREQGLEGERLAASLAEGLRRALPVDRGQAPERVRLHLLLDWLERWHYAPRWEAAAHGPRLFFHHCPYYEVLEEHPELCQMDVLLLEGCLGRRVVMIARGEWETPSAGVCIFQVQG